MAFINIKNYPTLSPNGGIDQIFQTPTSFRKFSMNATWNDLRKRVDHVGWHSIVWFMKNISRHAFILLLAIKGRLMTKDKFRSFGIANDFLCCFCKNVMESIDHLFFACSKTFKVWKEILLLSNTNYDFRSWKDYVNHISFSQANDNLKHYLRKLSFDVIVYFIC